jgi:hypothetical protein
MKKYCILLACLWGIFTSSTYANWDSLNVSSIEYDKATCTLSMVRNISGHHSDTYKYIVRWPVIVNIPLQSASGAGSDWSISPTTYIQYVVPTCDLTCSIGTSPISTISPFQVTGKDWVAPYTYTLAGFDRNIYVIRKTAIESCLRCQEGKYWCPSSNICINKGEACTNHQCNNDDECDINEGCGCQDCDRLQDHCAAGLLCNFVANNPNNSSCDQVECEEGQFWCPASQTCLQTGDICSSHQCNNDGICSLNEGCGCIDCDAQQDHCAETLVCRYNAANPNNSQCVTTECASGQYWCAETRACVTTNTPCGGICQSPLILNNNQCIPNGSCLPGNKCCPIGTYFCSLRSACVAAGQSCIK